MAFTCQTRKQAPLAEMSDPPFVSADPESKILVTRQSQDFRNIRLAFGLLRIGFEARLPTCTSLSKAKLYQPVQHHSRRFAANPLFLQQQPL
jgi:hypothetical protein